MKVAVIGSGISGIGTAWALSKNHHVTLYEAAPRPGGHARTIDVDMGDRSLPVDTGFIVYNERNYPNLVRLFATLGVPTKDSDMSFSVTDPTTGLEYAGSLSGVFARKSNLLRPMMWSLLRGIAGFRGEQDRLRAGAVPDNLTIAEYLEQRGYPKAFSSHYLLPLAAAVWSGTGNDVAEMPARTFLAFLANHGLIRLDDRPQWRTVDGGSRVYVERAVAAVDEVLMSHPVVGVERTAQAVAVTDAQGGRRSFDQIVLATHADRSLQILGPSATPAERAIIGSFRYASNRAVVHSDDRLMPSRRSAWSSWNAIGSVGSANTTPVTVTYWMNRLQSLPQDRQVFVSLNPTTEPDPELVIDDVLYQHPQFDTAAARGQAELGTIQGANRTWFAGAFCGYGFHEDGLQAGLTVAAELGSPALWHHRIRPMSPAATVAAVRPAVVAV
ncbi:MAG: FAD-dependent oxidoreductase [Acidimicrobiia bacterium]|nr:FAD-dependent oxidoreductase [Acidimicrobiia bacterium]